MVARNIVAPLIAAALVSMSGIASQAEISEREFQVVGTWGGLEHWKARESVFWNETLPGASEGKLTANAKPLTELGLSGFELLRQLRLGAFDFAHGVFSYVASDSPVIEGVDLAGIVDNLDAYREVMSAYRPILEQEFRDKFNAEILMLYPWPDQQMYCNLEGAESADIALGDLSGRKIRTYNATLGDFVEGFGASATTITFAEVIPAIEKGVVDCSITSVTAAYRSKLYQVTTHNFQLNLGNVGSFLAVNRDVWSSLSEEDRDIIRSGLSELEEEMWTATAANNVRGNLCTGKGPCDLGDPGGLIDVVPGDADAERTREIVETIVLKRWAKRCGAECAGAWNDTVGKVVGMTASAD
ncbi:MAG: TRAP transporter substrate-binding protein [Roseovarius sp.]|nr:TRAP transporter substrate-binding protein [Roseovarius sp.]MCY4207825.1 TRAP transporter substrate-binding protein [Roseovarius sp.]MCY4292796.1 TRAP transporter substrate-binding protein [Roseovarius sp.]